MLHLDIEQDLKLELPPQVEMIISALEAGRHPNRERRDMPRSRYRVHGRLRLFSDSPLDPPRTLYTRDVHARALGFVSEGRLPLGHGGTIELPHPDGGILIVRCTLFRCRQVVEGWYEGSVSFNREQPEFGRVNDSGAID